MNSDETWLLYLFSGTFAGVMSGGVAALVAMFVLRRTNEHQAGLAKAEADLQDSRATTQLTEQRKDLERQLKEQREGLELQLQAQMGEASKARELAAISDLLAGTMRLCTEYVDTPDKILDAKNSMQSAAFRWGLESNRNSMAHEVVRWVVRLYNLAALMHLEHHGQTDVRIEQKLDVDDPGAVFDSEYTAFMNLCTAYPTASDAAREVNWEFMRAVVSDPKPRSTEELQRLREQVEERMK